MRVLLSTIGSRGDVQPLVALALELRQLGQDVRLCVPPDFSEWVEALGLDVMPIGPAVSKAQPLAPATPGAPPSPEQIRQMAESTVASQFATIGIAAEGCDAIVGATALQIAAPSVADKLGIPYVFAAFCPAVLPSPHHAPPVYTTRGEKPAGLHADKGELWARNAASFNDSFRAALNGHRAAHGLAPVDDVRSHIFTEQPWLAADPELAPWPDPADEAVIQTGAWVVKDDRPLSPEIEAFLDSGEPPIYFGFGSFRAVPDLGRVMVRAARALGRRAIVLRGWAELSLPDNGRDCLSVGEINQQALFKRVAAVVHHGGAGTTTTAALASKPQVVMPQMYDQFYFAERIEELGLGAAHAPGAPTEQSLTSALERALRPDAAQRARAVAMRMRRDGARVAAARLVERG